MNALLWLLLGGLTVSALSRRAPPSPVVTTPVPGEATSIRAGAGAAPVGGLVSLTEPDDGVRTNFRTEPPYRPTVAEQVAALPNDYYNVFNAGEMATRPGVPDPVERSLRSSVLGLGGDFL